MHQTVAAVTASEIPRDHPRSYQQITPALIRATLQAEEEGADVSSATISQVSCHSSVGI